jgi:hypothetical protein
LQHRLPKPVLGDNTLNISFYGEAARITYTVEASSDLRTWMTEGVAVTEPNEAGQRVATVSQDSQTAFLRLVVAEVNDILTEAENLWKQGDHDGAWLKIEDMEPIDRVMPQVIDLRLRILTCTCRWELGDDLASVLRFAVDEVEEEEADFRNRYSITCAEYYHARARALVVEGNIDGAKERLKLAAEQWPPIRLEMVDDPDLYGIW